MLTRNVIPTIRISPSAPIYRGLHSCTFWLNVSAFCGIGGAFRGCRGVFSRFSGVLWGVKGVFCVSNG